MKRFLWRLQALFLQGVIWLLSWVPAAITPWAGRRLGQIFMLIAPKRVAIAEDNVTQVAGFISGHPLWGGGAVDAKQIARGMFYHLGQSVVEIGQLYYGRAGYLVTSIELRGVEHYQQAKEKGAGVLLLTGHCGNWEVVGTAFSMLFKTGLSVVARKQNNPYLNDFIEQVRQRYNNTVIYKQNAVRGLLSVTRSAGIAVLLVDQALKPEEGGVLVPFLGRPAWTARTPVVVARKTGVAVVPAFSFREGDHHVIEFHPELHFSQGDDEAALAADVALYSQALEAFVVAHPTNWFWLHKRWKDYC